VDLHGTKAASAAFLLAMLVSADLRPLHSKSRRRFSGSCRNGAFSLAVSSVHEPRKPIGGAAPPGYP